MKPRILRIGFILYLLYLILPVSANAVLQERSEGRVRMSLDECITRALKLSPEIAAGQAQVGIAQAQHQEAMSLKILPKLDLTNALTVAPGVNLYDNELLNLETRNNWRQIGLFNRLELNFLQPLYSFGRIQGSIDAASYGIEAREQAVRQKRNEIYLRITKLYLSRLLAEELLGVADEARDTIEKAESTLKEMLASDDYPDVNEADLFRINLFKIELEKTHREIKSNRDLTLAALKAYLGWGRDVDFDISDDFLDAWSGQIETLEHYQNLKHIHRPEISQLDAAVAAQDALARVSRSFYYPQFFLGGGTVLSLAPVRDDIHNPFLKDPFNYKRFGAYLGISMPLNFRQTRARISKAEYELDRIMAQREAAIKVIDLEVEEAYTELLGAKQNMDSNKQALKISREWVTTEQISFDIDGTNAKDLVDAVQAQLKAKAAHYQAIYTYNLAVSKLDFTTGTIGKN